MSWDTYQQAIDIMEKNEEKCDFVGERSEELIIKAENALGLKFSKIYRDFVQRYGAGNFGSEEVYGVINDDFDNSSVPDATWVTLSERKECNLPRNLLVIYHTGGIELLCLDFNNLDDKEEPKVVSFYPGFELNVQKYEVIANDFGDFLLNLFEAENSY